MSDTGVHIILPEVSDDEVSGGLRRLVETMHLNKIGDAHDAMGLLGGEFGYGIDFANDTFEMFPFWWGDCECGHEEAEGDWYDAHGHALDCYQAELEKRSGEDLLSDAPKQLAKEWGLSEFGCAVHCTCDYEPRYKAWAAEHSHDPRCPVVRPNFCHRPSGSEVRWYKYIGRSMELDVRAPWDQIMRDCIDSLARTA